MTPQRIQLRRTKGWRMPPNTVSVARPTKWGNPYIVGRYGVRNAQVAVDCYRDWIDATRRIDPHWDRKIAELRGKNLACWCKPGAPCHADVLLELANRSMTEGKR